MVLKLFLLLHFARSTHQYTLTTKYLEMDVDESGLVVIDSLPSRSAIVCISHCFTDQDCMLVHFSEESGVCNTISLDLDNLPTPVNSGGISIRFQKHHLSKLIQIP